MTVLTTQRLTLRPVEPGDFAALCPIWSDKDFLRGIGLPPLTPETVWFRLLRDIGHWQVYGHGNWAVVHDGAFIGTVGIFDYRRDMEPPLDTMEAGWGLTPAVHGKGFALEALTAILHHADTVLNLPETVCIIASDNAPSLKLAEKVGYVDGGEVSYRGERILLLRRANGQDAQ